jgi:hypothetical protein
MPSVQQRPGTTQGLTTPRPREVLVEPSEVSSTGGSPRRGLLTGHKLETPELASKPHGDLQNMYLGETFSSALHQARGGMFTPTGRRLRKAEVKEMLIDYNEEVFESRVTKAYVNDELRRSMHMQRLLDHARRQRMRLREIAAMHRTIERTVGTPRGKRLVQTEELRGLMQALDEKEKDTPRFRDLDALLSPRAMTAPSSSFTSPSVDLTRFIPLPAMRTLLSPRGHVTSPLPDTSPLYLPPEPSSVIGVEGRGSGSATSARQPTSMSLVNLLRFIGRALREKQTADSLLRAAHDQDESRAKLRNRPGSSSANGKGKDRGGMTSGLDAGAAAGPKGGAEERRMRREGCQVDRALMVPMGEIVRRMLKKDYGAGGKKFVAEKAAQLRLSCDTTHGHGNHPRVALFRRMACLEEGAERWSAAKEAACMQIASWLQIVPPNEFGGAPGRRAPACDAQLLLTLRDAAKLGEHLRRLRLVPREAVPYLIQLARGILIASQGLASSASPRDAPPAAAKAAPGTPQQLDALAALRDIMVPPAPVSGPDQIRKLDADELLLRFMTHWGGWVDEAMRDDYDLGLHGTLQHSEAEHKRNPR